MCNQIIWNLSKSLRRTYHLTHHDDGKKWRNGERWKNLENLRKLRKHSMIQWHLEYFGVKRLTPYARRNLPTNHEYAVRHASEVRLNLLPPCISALCRWPVNQHGNETVRKLGCQHPLTQCSETQTAYGIVSVCLFNTQQHNYNCDVIQTQPGAAPLTVYQENTTLWTHTKLVWTFTSKSAF